MPCAECVDRSLESFLQVACDGLSELVRGQKDVFVSLIDRELELLDSAATRLLPVRSPGCSAGRLLLEERTCPTNRERA